MQEGHSEISVFLCFVCLFLLLLWLFRIKRTDSGSLYFGSCGAVKRRGTLTTKSRPLLNWCLENWGEILFLSFLFIFKAIRFLFFYFFPVCPVVVLFFFYFSFIFISWRLITLQYCSGFCHTLTWISHGFTCIPHPDPPSHLPLYPLCSLWFVISYHLRIC